MLPGKVSNLESSRSERDVLPITPPGTLTSFAVSPAIAFCSLRRRSTSGCDSSDKAFLDFRVGGRLSRRCDGQGGSKSAALSRS